MGWEEERNRAAQFKQQTSAARARRKKQLTLNHNAPVTTRHSYECVPEPGAPMPKAGAKVLFINTPDGIDIYDGNQFIAQVKSEQVAIAREQEGLAKQASQSVEGQVARVAKNFTVEITD